MTDDEAVTMAASRTPNAFTDFITVLVLVGIPAGPVNRTLSRHAIDSSPDGVLVNVFSDVASLPRYREDLEAWVKPDAVIDLRLAAAESDAVLVLTSYRGRIPSMVHNAIDWLTRRWQQAGLHDKPFAVVGRSAGCYTGVWLPQIADTRGGLGTRAIEPLTVLTLRDAVKKLADEVRGGSSAAVM
jgi:NAD(P)H-dependent FMN reductase